MIHSSTLRFSLWKSTYVKTDNNAQHSLSQKKEITQSHTKGIYSIEEKLLHHHEKACSQQGTGCQVSGRRLTTKDREEPFGQ